MVKSKVVTVRESRARREQRYIRIIKHLLEGKSITDEESEFLNKSEAKINAILAGTSHS